MAIGPQILEAAFMSEVDKYEKELDAILTGKKISPNSTISVSPPQGMNYSHFQKLKDRYLKAGWGNVTWHDSQLDGTYIVFDTKTRLGTVN